MDPDAGNPARVRRRDSPPPGAPSSAPPPAPPAIAALSGRRPPWPSLSREPALAAAVVLRVPEVLPPCPTQAQVELLHVGVPRERRRISVHHHPARLEDVAVVGEPERGGRVLLGEE